MSLNAGQGPGNLSPDKHYMQFLAAEAIDRGECVCVSNTADDGYTVVLSDVDAVATSAVIGVAAEDIASGAWGKVQIAGFCDYIITDENVAAGQMLIPDATAGAATGAAISTANSTGFGQALADDATALLSAAMLWRRM